MKRLGELLSRLTEKLELNTGHDRQSVLGEWERLVGEEIGRIAHPAGFRKSVLVLRVFHPAAAMEIRLRKREILDKLNGFAGRVLFDSLRVICSGTDSSRRSSEG